jgi:hypothetical protein
LIGPFTTMSIHVAMDTSIQVLRHQHLARFFSSRRQVSNDKRNSVASKDNGVQNQNCKYSLKSSEVSEIPLFIWWNEHPMYFCRRKISRELNPRDWTLLLVCDGFYHKLLNVIKCQVFPQPWWNLYTFFMAHKIGRLFWRFVIFQCLVQVSPNIITWSIQERNVQRTVFSKIIYLFLLYLEYTVTCRGDLWAGFWIGWLDLLTHYTLNSRL